MVLKLKGGRLYDPAHGVNGEVRDIHVRDGRVIERPERGERIEREYDLAGRVVMAGAIDIHTHIGGGKVNLARAMLPEDHRNDPVLHTELSRASSGRAAPGTFAAGYRYAAMGYTSCF
jgi:formylmethanofuran dehydrogenase subunit A